MTYTPFAMSIQPYRTLDNVIEGAVISFVEITAMVKAQDVLSEAEALGMNVRDRIPKGLRAAALATLAPLSGAEILEPYFSQRFSQRITKGGETLQVSIISTALISEKGLAYAIATTERAISGSAQ
ncbi:MAG: two-component system CheB/CheR fusion protein [Planctomycetota bacterium]|jgi:two-component system CheB/CheR fusion protein